MGNAGRKGLQEPCGCGRVAVGLVLELLLEGLVKVVEGARDCENNGDG